MDIVKGIVSILLMIPGTYFFLKIALKDETGRYILVMLLVILAFGLGLSYWADAPIWDF